MEKVIEPAKVLAVLSTLVASGGVRPAEAFVYRVRHETPSFPLEKMAHWGITSEADVQSVFARVESRYEDWVGVSQGPSGSDA